MTKNTLQDPPLPLEQGEYLGEKLLIVHGRYSIALAPLFRPARMPQMYPKRKGCR
jgi:hypothetical protein